MSKKIKGTLVRKLTGGRGGGSSSLKKKGTLDDFSNQFQVPQTDTGFLAKESSKRETIDLLLPEAESVAWCPLKGHTYLNLQLKAADDGNLKKWLHPAKDLKYNYVTYFAKYLGVVTVMQAKGVEIVKDAIKKLKIVRQMQKSEVGHRGSKLVKVEIRISIDFIRILEAKSSNLVCSRPLHRVSYCADDHTDKRLFAFIAKDQVTKKHECFVLICDKEAAELTITLGQAFQMAFRRYMETEKKELKENKSEIDFGKRVAEELKNDKLMPKASEKKPDTTQKLAEEKARSGSIGNEGNAQMGGTFFNFENAKTTSNNSFETLSPGFQTVSADFQAISNPLLMSPDSARLSRNVMASSVSYQARFSNDSWISAQHEAFDPFNEMSVVGVSNNNNENLNQISNTSVQHNVSDDDFFNEFDSKEIISNSDGSIETNKPLQDMNPEQFYKAGTTSGSFEDLSAFSRSPKEDDFLPKADPFADVPDWNSVASEEVNSNQSKGSSVCLDQVDIQGSDFIRYQEPFSPTDSNDVFDNYLTNVVAHRTQTFSQASSQEKLNDRDNPFNQMNGKSSFSFSNEELSSTNPFVQSATFDNSFSENKTLSHSLDHLSLNSSSTPRDISQNTRVPRRTPKDTRSQEGGLIAPPPTKALIKGTKSVPVKQPVKSPITTTKPVVNGVETSSTPVSRERTKSVKSIGVLPNVAPVSADAQTNLQRRSRASGSFTVKPIGESIKLASKSLENLTDLNETSGVLIYDDTQTSSRTAEGNLVEFGERALSPQGKMSTDYFKDHISRDRLPKKAATYLPQRQYQSFEDNLNMT